MTSGKHRKALVRQRAARTGESYTTALRQLRFQQEGQMSTTPSVPATIALSCSFCSKPAPQVRKLIAGPGVYICNECVTLCQDILAEDESPWIRWRL